MEFDIGDFVNVLTRQKVKNDIRKKAIKRRKELKISQKELAKRSSVSYGSIRRFEKDGEISLSSLLAIGEILNSLDDFEKLFSTPMITNLKDFKV